MNKRGSRHFGRANAGFAAYSFSILAIALLFTEIFSPLAYGVTSVASGPAVAAGSSGVQTGTGDCNSNSLTPTQTKAFWDATLGFMGQELNALTYQQLLNNKAGAIASQPQNLTVVIDPDSAKFYPVKDIASVMGRDPAQVAEDLNADANGSVDMATVKAYMAAKPGKEGALERLLGIKPKLEVEKPAFDSYKIKLPNQRDIGLREIFAMQEIGGGNDKCLLDHSDIRGKVSYIVLLGKDLYIGFDKSSTTTNANQHLTSTNTLAALSLNGGSDIIIPLRFMNYLKTVKFIGELDTIGSILETGMALVDKKAVEQGLASQRDLEERVGKVGVADNINYRDIQNEVTGGVRLKRDVYDLMSQPGEAGVKRVLASSETAVASMEEEAKTLAKAGKLAEADAIRADADKIKRQSEEIQKVYDNLKAEGLSDDDFRDALSKQLGENFDSVMGAYNFNGLERNVVNMQSMAQRIRLSDLDTQFRLKQLCPPYGACTDVHLKPLERIYATLAGRAFSNFVFGMLWLGPGRLALTASNAITFSSSDRRLADNYLQIYVDGPVAPDFRSASNWMLSGKVVELLSDLTHSGIPTAIFDIGPVYLLNQPDVGTSAEEGRASFTSLKNDVDRWNIATYWKGRSAGTLFEDIKNRNDYARMSMFSNNMTLGANLERRNEMATYYDILTYAAPLLSWKLLRIPGTDPLLFTMGRIATLDFYISNIVDPNRIKNDEVCSDEKVDSYKHWYEAFVVASQVSNILMLPEGQALKSVASRAIKDFSEREVSTKAGKTAVTMAKLMSPDAPINKVMARLNIFVQALSPFDMAKAAAASMGFQYTMRCKDTSYTILAYQSLDKKTEGGAAALKEKLNPLGVDKIVGNLSIGNALQGVGTQVAKEDLNEIINTRALMQDQSGMVTPTKLYYLHLDGATQEWWGVFDQLEKGGCFRKCIDGNYTAICMTENGVELINKLTGERTKLADKDHALMSQFLPELAATMVPNTLISAKMNCGAQQTVLQVKSDAHLYTGGTCGTVQCLIAELSRLTGTAIGSDLSGALGKVKAIHTDQGLATVDGGVIRYIRTAGTESEVRGIGVGTGSNPTEVIAEDEETGTLTKKTSQVGKETQIPSIDSQLDDSASLSASTISIRGDATVSASGSSGTTDMGTLMTINLERGRIEYDKAGQRLLVALYILGEVNAPQSIQSIGVAATNNVDENGQETPAIRVDSVQAKPGQEEFTEGFNKGLQSVQGDGGMQMFDTADKTYYFTTDAAGNPVLRILDKKTGKFTEYKITGQVTSDGKSVNVPTDKGPFNFNFAMNDKGQPTMSVSGPDGYKDIATLLAARGQNGIIIFDPATGTFRALNGQDISLNRDFATKGLTYVGSPEGVRGVPTDNFLDYRQKPGTGDSGGLNPLLLPSFPENAAVAGLMIATMLLGVVAIRLRQTGANAKASRRVRKRG
ncbi:MAG: hypothetical protein WC792_02825 [Candidatus Micrarchaeia archaeon]|jgi:hypothetical protein